MSTPESSDGPDSTSESESTQRTVPLALSVGFIFIAVSFMLRTAIPDAVRFGVGLPVLVVATALAVSTWKARRAHRR